MSQRLYSCVVAEEYTFEYGLVLTAVDAVQPLHHLLFIPRSSPSGQRQSVSVVEIRHKDTNANLPDGIESIVCIGEFRLCRACECNSIDRFAGPVSLQRLARVICGS